MKIPSNARCLVTGAGSGFGRAISLALAKRGGRVLATDLDLASAEETARMVEGLGGAAVALALDVRKSDEVKAAVDRALSDWGGLDVLVNNAGVAVAGAVGDVPLEDWQFAVEINLLGVIYGCHFGVPAMKRGGGGFILNVASAAGIVSAPSMAPYNVTKAGVIALSETLYTEVAGAGIVVSALCPTFFRTNIHRSQRSTEALRGRSLKLVTEAKWSADAVAEVALKGLENGDLYILPQTDAKLAWRAKRALGQGFFALVARGAKRVLRDEGGAK
jgi:short-subunit dehydrogenase